jgi:hypothetical protein
MGSVTLDRLIRVLGSHNVRAGRAFPAEEITRVLSPVAALSLDSANQEKRTVPVLAEILGPQKMGGSACQELAAEVCEILKEEGALCRMGSCKFLSKGNLFRVPVWAVFQEEPEYHISVEGRPLPHVCGFVAWQEAEEELQEISSALWYYRLEEFFPWGTIDTLETGDSFLLQFYHSGVKEDFEGCQWRKQIRTAEADGIRQVREGLAMSRVITGT